MEDKVYMATVSQINQYIKQIMDKNVVLSNVWVKGELSNCKKHYSGHIYMTLKDDGGVLKAVMFRNSAAKLVFEPQDGMRVMARGHISVYEKGGAYQLYIEEMQPDGVGALHIAFEQMKERLEKEGLFDSKYKKPIPIYPQTIGVITAATGAAVRDVIHVLGRRAPYAKILLYPCLVQGEGASREISEAISYFNREKCCDVLIVGRGGGSIEDLWAFNEEDVARAIFISDIPIISAVGHETDFTIADFVADMRAPTPSAAAEIAAADIGDTLRQLSASQNRMTSCVQSLIRIHRTSIARFRLRNPKDRIDNMRVYLDGQIREVDHAWRVKNREDKNKLALLSSKLQTLDPTNVLARGYCMATDSEGAVINSAKKMSIGDKIKLTFGDGKKDCEVK